jgi:hypothetical protein
VFFGGLVLAVEIIQYRESKKERPSSDALVDRRDGDG